VEDVAFLIYAPDEERKDEVTMNELYQIAGRVRQPLVFPLLIFVFIFSH
jgi:hypothetical protein